MNNLDTRHDTLPKRWGAIPWDSFDEWHVNNLIQEQADIALDLGLYKQMLENPNLRLDNRALVVNLQELDGQRYWLLDNEIERLRNEQGRPKRLHRAG